VKVLVANIGSTSFKYRLYRLEDRTVLAQGRAERIGQVGGCPDHLSAIQGCIAELVGPGKPLGKLDDLDAVGFKAVHAGPEGGLKLVDDQLLQTMERFSFLAAAHNPPYVKAMRAFRSLLPNVPMVALFETAFFDIPEAARTYAVPEDWKQKLGVQRYGFHGASHRYAAERAQALLGRSDLRQISCHLGGSSSLAAIRNGIGIDSSFGMSPQSGLPHNNRVGDLDPFSLLYVMKETGAGVEQMADVLCRESGLKGISGVSGDVRDLLAVPENPRARLALDVLVHSVRHYLGAFLVRLGGLDVLSFSGGIGENSPEIRSAVCRDLKTFGIVLDEKKNNSGNGERDLASANSRIPILVVPADEEWIVARSAGELLKAADQLTAGSGQRAEGRGQRAAGSKK